MQGSQSSAFPLKNAKTRERVTITPRPYLNRQHYWICDFSPGTDTSPLPIMGSSIPIPPQFTAKKEAILASLSVAEPLYTDLSPKGSIDEAIRPLIERVNALEGVVTTSSCAGRVSVFLEGIKHADQEENRDDAESSHGGSRGQAAVPGGKGMGGRWLFVSHSPVQFPTGEDSIASRFGMEDQSKLYDDENPMEFEQDQVRLARFQFEPMVREISCYWGSVPY